MTEDASTNGCEGSRRQAKYRHHPDTGTDEMRNNTNSREDNTCPEQDYNRTPLKYESVRCTHNRFFGGGGRGFKYTMSQYFLD